MPVSREDGASLVADLDIYDENNQLVAQIRGLRSQRVDGGWQTRSWTNCSMPMSGSRRKAGSRRSKVGWKA